MSPPAQPTRAPDRPEDLGVAALAVGDPQVPVEQAFLVPLVHGDQEVLEGGFGRAVLDLALFDVEVVFDPVGADEGPRQADVVQAYAGDGRDDQGRVGVLLLLERLEHGVPFVDGGRHLEPQILQPVAAEHGPHVDHQVVLDAEEGEDVVFAGIGLDHLVDCFVGAEDLPEAGGVLAHQAVQIRR